MKDFKDLKNEKSDYNFGYRSSRLKVSNGLFRLKNKGGLSNNVYKARLSESYPSLTIKKVYAQTIAFDCGLCHGQFYLTKKEMKGCPVCRTYYAYIIYMDDKLHVRVGSEITKGILWFYRTGTMSECVRLASKWEKNIGEYRGTD